MSRTSLPCRILSGLVSIVMVVSLTPMAWADEPTVTEPDAVAAGEESVAAEPEGEIVVEAADEATGLVANPASEGENAV
ncbi:MAG: hypothetical protein IKE20_04230, partial [Eggerthellaceae bacterium]|nr:hypothetical protein [Eggerthellaceae bacterium]